MTPLFNRFLLGFLLTLLLSMTWSVPLLLVGAREGCYDDVTRWLRHDLAYGVVHHVFFPVAVGIFFASIKLKVFRNAGRVALLALVSLLIIAALLTIDDALAEGRKYQPYELEKACRWLCFESVLREVPTKMSLPPHRMSEVATCMGNPGLADKPFAARAYFNRHRTFDGLYPLLSNTNGVGRASLFLTWLFISFCAVFVWYCGIVFLQETVSDAARFRLSGVLCLLTVWIPCRIYTNWYQSAYLGLPPRNNTALVGGILSIGVFAFLLFSAIVNKRIAREAALDALGILIPILGFLLVKYRDYIPEMSEALAGLTGLQVITVCFVLCFLLIIGARLALTGPEVEAE